MINQSNRNEINVIYSMINFKYEKEISDHGMKVTSKYRKQKIKHVKHIYLIILVYKARTVLFLKALLNMTMLTRYGFIDASMKCLL